MLYTNFKVQLFKYINSKRYKYNFVVYKCYNHMLLAKA